MSINSELIRKREEENNAREANARNALLNDEVVTGLFNEQDRLQNALLFILELFHLDASRIYGNYTLESMLEQQMDPVGVMYRHSDDLARETADHTQVVLAFDQDGEPVTLYPTLIGYHCFHPATSKTSYCSRHFISTLKADDCYVFTQPMKIYNSIVFTFIINVLRYLTPYDVFDLLVAASVSTYLGLQLPKINSWIYKVFLKNPDGQIGRLQLMLGVYLSIGICRIVINTLKAVRLNRVKNRVSLRVQAIVMARILDLPRSFFSSNSSGKISKRISQCNNMTNTIINIFMDALLNFSFSGAYLAQMHTLSPELFAPATVFLLIRLSFSVYTALLSMFIDRRSISLSMETDSFFYSVIKGIIKIKSIGVEKTVYAKWADMYQKMLHNIYHQPFLLRHSGQLSSLLATVTTLTLMSTTALTGLSQEDYMVFTSSFAMFSSVVDTLTSMMTSAFRISTIAESIKPIFTTETMHQQRTEYVRSIHGNIEVDNVNFAYDADQIGCLRGVSLQIKAGEKIAIVGESGCGKSTLLKIIMGMEVPDSGTVLYDDKNINDLNMSSLRQKIGSVFQFSKLFPGTIYDNVTFGCFEDVPEEKVWDALRKACIADYVAEQPLQLNTEVSESNSCGFSGGQRQRLLIARALLRNPSVLVLDEATSALDNITQKQVLDNVLNLNSTVIMVAHRLSTVMQFDRIIMLKDGNIVESGSYDELMAENGLFAELVAKQVVEEEKEMLKADPLPAVS